MLLLDCVLKTMFVLLMSKGSYIARRYAGSLFAAALDVNKQNKVLEEIDIFYNSFCSDKKTSHILLSTSVPAKIKFMCINTAIEGVSFTNVLVNFLHLLVQNNRLNMLKLIIKQYRDFLHHHKNEAVVEVVGAIDINKNMQSDLSCKIADILNKKVILVYKVQSNLIGGIVINIGNTRLDCSIKKQLCDIRELVLTTN